MIANSGSPHTRLAALWQDIFLSRKGNNMTMNAKANVISVSLDTAFVGGVCASISNPDLSVFEASPLCCFSWLL